MADADATPTPAPLTPPPATTPPATAPAAAPAAQTTVVVAPPRKRKRRWLIRLPIILLLFLVVLVVLVHFLLASDYPRQIAESQISRILNVNATARALKIEWSGHTRLEGLSITLPLSDEPILQVEHVDIRHTPLAKLVFAQQVQRVEIDGVRVDLREQADGHWNIEQLIASRPKGDPDSKSSRTGSDLPNLIAKDVSVRVTRFDGRRGVMTDLSVEALKSGAFAYNFDARAGTDAGAKGSIALAGDLRHEVVLELARVPELANLFVAKLPSPLSGKLTWSGRLIAGGGLDGRVSDLNVAVAAFTAKGGGDVRVTPHQEVTLTPRQFHIHRAGAEPIDLLVETGAITASPTYARIAIPLRGKVAEGTFAVDGTFNPKDWATDLWIGWKGLRRKDLGTSGYAEVHASRNFAGIVTGNAMVSGIGELPDGKITGSFWIGGHGESLSSLRASFKSQPCTFEKKDGSIIAVPGVIGDVRGDGNVIQLTSLQPQDAPVTSVQTNAGIDRVTKRWWAAIETRGLRLPALQKLGVVDPLDISLDAYGDSREAELDRVFVKVGPVAVWGNGNYNTLLPKPLSLLTYIWYQHKTQVGDEAQLSELEAFGEVVGTLWPRRFSGKGELYAKNIVVAGRTFGDVNLSIQNATLNEWQAHLESQDIEMLGARWTLNGDWTAFSRKPLTVVATWTNLPAASIGELANLEKVEGNIDKGIATFAIPSMRLRDVKMGAWLQGGGIKYGPIEVESLSANAWLKDGMLGVQPVLNNGRGQINALAGFDITRRKTVTLDAWLTNWTSPKVFKTGKAADLSAVATGGVKASFDIPTKTLKSAAKIEGQINRAEGRVGAFKVDAASDENSVTLNEATLETLDGTATATGKADLNNLNAMVFDAKFDRFAPSELAWMYPFFKDAEGRYSGVLSVHPSSGGRPLGPSEIEFRLQPKDAFFRSIEIGPIDVTAYATYESRETFRVVTEKAEINIAGGRVLPFARVTNNEGRGLTQLVTAKFNDIDIKQVVKAVDDDGKEVVGRASGEMRVIGAARSLGTITAEVDAKLEKSDLANIGPIAAMYNTARVFSGPTEPNGEGTVSMTLERGTVTLTNLSYFNRGMDIRAYGEATGVADLDTAKLSMTLLGSARPFRDIKLPFFEDLDKTLAAVQQSATTIIAEGTVREPQARSAALSEVGDSVRAILLGNVKKEQQGK